MKVDVVDSDQEQQIVAKMEDNNDESNDLKGVNIQKKLFFTILSLFVLNKKRHL